MRIDQLEIRDVMYRYCRGVDRNHLALVRSSYHDDAIEHHTGYDGGIDGFIAYLESTLARYDGVMHLIGNQLITIAGAKAVSESYGLGVHWVQDRHDSRNFTSGLRYIDRLECRDGNWAIVERWAVRDWVRSDVSALAASETEPRGTADRSDPLYGSLAWLEQG